MVRIRYYFNVTDGSNFYRDAEGVLCDDFDAAKEYACDVARDLLEEGECDEFWIDVRNENGGQVIRVNVKTRH